MPSDPWDEWRDPRSLILEYPPLAEAIRPLADLASLSPNTLDTAIALAMAMGIAAAEKKHRRWQEPPPDPLTQRLLWKYR